MKVFTQQDLLTINTILMSDLQQFCGIDVSKSTLDFIVLSTTDNTRISTKDIRAKSKDFEQIPNTLTSIETKFSQSEFDQTLFVLEATGTYSSKLLHQLSKLNRPISVVSPYQSKAYMVSKGITNKNDKNAAFCLDQIHALEQNAEVNELSLTSLKQVLHHVSEQLTKLEEQLYQPSQDPDYEEKMKHGTSVIGIGQKTAEALLLATNGLHGFETSGAVAKCLGIIPHSHYSGSSVKRKGGITKFGNNTVRGLLYMCTRSAIQHNKACKETYYRLRAKGKPHKVAAVAVMHKLVKQFFACVTFKRMFDNDYHAKQQTEK